MRIALLVLTALLAAAGARAAARADTTWLPMTCAGGFDYALATGVSYDADGSLYAWSLDLDGIARYGADGTLLASWSGATNQPPIELVPLSVAADGLGTVYVSNYALNRIERYSRAGTWNGSIGAGGLASPIGIAVDRRNGRVAVIDRVGTASLGQVRVFLNGSVMFSFAADHHPVALAITDAGDIYLAGLYGWVERRSEWGALLDSWTLPDAGPNVRFTALAVSPGGRVHVADGGSRLVHVLASDLSPLGEWDISCMPTPTFCRDDLLWGVAIDAQGNATLSRECLAGNVERFAPNSTVPARPLSWGALKTLYR
jgi:hypothetical protein